MGRRPQRAGYGGGVTGDGGGVGVDGVVGWHRCSQGVSTLRQMLEGVLYGSDALTSGSVTHVYTPGGVYTPVSEGVYTPISAGGEVFPSHGVVVGRKTLTQHKGA